MMGRPDYWGVAGYPISHSLTPRLFEIVGEKLGFEDVRAVFLEAESFDDFMDKASDLEGDIWISCTTPLKNSIWEGLGIEVEDGLDSVNQVVRSNGEWKGANTDGDGFVDSCRHIGIDPNMSTLRIRGGGSAARSIAVAWAGAEGDISMVSGRRKLVDGPWSDSITERREADIATDLDALPGGGESVDLGADRQVSISYAEGAGIEEFAVIMVAAQHLEAWRTLFAPEMSAELPSLPALLDLLRKER